MNEAKNKNYEGREKRIYTTKCTGISNILDYNHIFESQKTDRMFPVFEIYTS